MKINILESIKKRQAFKTNNIEAYYIGKEYVIKSYNTIVYSDSLGLDFKKYTHTTSKLQKIIAEAFRINFKQAKRIEAINGVDYQLV